MLPTSAAARLLPRLANGGRNLPSPTKRNNSNLLHLAASSKILSHRIDEDPQSPPKRGVSSSSSGSSTVVNPLKQNTAAHSTVPSRTAPQPMPTTHDPSVLRSILDINSLTSQIHEELDAEMKDCTEMADLNKYYFDAKGKSVRPVIAMTLAHAYNHHYGLDSHPDSDLIRSQRDIAIIVEMIHTSSLLHDDVLDHAESRRGKASVNRNWDETRSVMSGSYVLAIAAKILSRIRNEDVLQVMSRVLGDLVEGEFQQLQTKTSETERFQLYLRKTFNKTASLIAYSCKSNAILAGADEAMAEAAFQYGKHLGIAFQLKDDLLDFEASAELLGKPAGADLQLGLATAPVLFACSEHPEIEAAIARRFSQPGDVEQAFKAVQNSTGLERTRELARTHCEEAVKAIAEVHDSPYKWALEDWADKVVSREK